MLHIYVTNFLSGLRRWSLLKDFHLAETVTPDWMPILISDLRAPLPPPRPPTYLFLDYLNHRFHLIYHLQNARAPVYSLLKN